MLNKRRRCDESEYEDCTEVLAASPYEDCNVRLSMVQGDVSRELPPLLFPSACGGKRDRYGAGLPRQAVRLQAAGQAAWEERN